jgi:hypothetical protein
MAANEAAAAAAVRIVNTAQVSYNSAYPTAGFSSSLANLGGASCAAPTSTNACLIDQVLAAGQRSGYSFVLTNVSGTPASSYAIIATPILSNYSGVRNFCSFEDAVLRGSLTTITTCDGSVSPQQ